MRPVRMGTAFCIGFVLSLCYGIGSIAAQDNAGLPDSIALHRELRYREGTIKPCTLDLAAPKPDAAKRRPAIVLIHGGGWIEGDKSSFSTVENRAPANIIDFAKLGFVAVTINYRMSREAPYPAALQDCQCAVRWLRANADKYQIDPQRIGAWGNSAGGHLALLLGMVDHDATLEPDAPYRDQSSRVQAVVSDSGPIDLVRQYEHSSIKSVVELFMAGPPDATRMELYKRASPMSHISVKTAPLLLIYGGVDTQVPVETADQFVVKLHDAGVKDVSYLRLATTDHCPHSLIQVPWVKPAVNDFFVRTLNQR